MDTKNSEVQILIIRNGASKEGKFVERLLTESCGYRKVDWKLLLGDGYEDIIRPKTDVKVE